MASPFDKHREPATAGVGLREWCDTQNRKQLFERMGRWYFVAKSDGVERIDSLDGTDGENVRRLLDGTLPDFAGWSAARMDGYRKWLRSVAEQGLLESPRIAA
jgi:hypothetical protein